MCLVLHFYFESAFKQHFNKYSIGVYISGFTVRLSAASMSCSYLYGGHFIDMATLTHVFSFGIVLMLYNMRQICVLSHQSTSNEKKRLCTISKKTLKNRRSIASALIYNCQYSLSVEAVYNGKSVNAFCFTIVFYYLSIVF